MQLKSEHESGIVASVCGHKVHDPSLMQQRPQCNAAALSGCNRIISVFSSYRAFLVAQPRGVKAKPRFSRITSASSAPFKASFRIAALLVLRTLAKYDTSAHNFAAAFE